MKWGKDSQFSKTPSVVQIGFSENEDPVWAVLTNRNILCLGVYKGALLFGNYQIAIERDWRDMGSPNTPSILIPPSITVI